MQECAALHRAPLLVLEVASRSAVKDDVGDKQRAYEAIGAAEYLVFDPDGALLTSPLLAWRLEGERYVPWQPDEDGLWRSAVLGVALRATRPLLTVYDDAGQEIPGTAGLHTLAERLQAELAAERQQWIVVEEELRRLRESGSFPSNDR